MANAVKSAASSGVGSVVFLVFDKYELELIDYVVIKYLKDHGHDIGLNRIHEAIRDNLKEKQNVL